MRRALILFASLGIMGLGLWGTAVIYLDENRLKGVVAAHMAEHSGRKLEIRGALKVRFFPRLHLHAEDVVIGSPPGFDGPEFLEADHLSMSVRMLPLVRGQVSTGEVSVTGATVNLHTNADGASSFDGLGRGGRNGDAREETLLATRQMRLEDIRLVVSDVSTNQRETVLIEWVELDRFQFDSRLDFRFRGNLGEPPLFDEMGIEGQLYVPSTRERPLRLSNMHLEGRLSATGEPLVLLGNLSFSAAPPLMLELDQGRLRLDGQEFDLSGRYDGRDRGHLVVDASGERLDWSKMKGPGVVKGADWLAFTRGMDMDLSLQFTQASFAGIGLEDLSAAVQAREGVVEFSDLAAFVPGGFLQAGGRFDARYQPPRGRLEMEIEMADVAGMLSAADVPAMVSGSGEGSLSLDFTGEESGFDSMHGTGEFELWDGHWVMAANDDEQQPNRLEFERFAGQFRLMPGHFDLPEIQLRSAGREALGWAAIDLADYSLGGQLVVVGNGREIELSGSLRQPRLSATLHPAVEDRGAGGL